MTLWQIAAVLIEEALGVALILAIGVYWIAPVRPAGMPRHLEATADGQGPGKVATPFPQSNARLLARKWARRPESARALYRRLHPDQEKPSYTLAELLAQMPEGPATRVPEWEAAPPVGREFGASAQEDVA